MGSRPAKFVEFEQEKRQLTLLKQQQDQLLNLRLFQEIDSETFSRKSAELSDRTATLSGILKADSADRNDHAKMAARVFELSQGLEQKWVGAKYLEKKQLLDLACLNVSLADVSLVADMRKPFNMLVEASLVLSNWGDGTPVELFCVLCSEMKVSNDLLLLRGTIRGCS